MRPIWVRCVSCMFVTLSSAAATLAQSTICVNLKPDGFPGDVSASFPSLSADGRYVAFASRSQQLLPGAGGRLSIFVREVATNTIVLASVDSTGAAADGESRLPKLSADGNWIAFGSDAANLVAGDTNGVSDVFLHNLATGATTRVSVSTTGAQASSPSTPSSISADGRFVAFETLSTLVASDTNARLDVYVHDRVSGTTNRVSVGNGGTQSMGSCAAGSLSADGSRVAFTCTADDLIPGDTNGARDVLVRDRVANTTQLVSVSSSGAASDGASSSPVIAGDGNSVAFVSFASNLASRPPASGPHVYVRVLQNGTTDLVDGGGGDAIGEPDISHDGRFVAFIATDAELVPGDTNEAADVYVRDRQTGAVQRASLGAVGQQADEGFMRATSVSDDGRFVAFQTDAENLVPADANLVDDLLLHDFQGAPTGQSYCLGDGTGAQCPCGNNGSVGRGCGHSNDAEGAELFAMGTASVSADSVRLGARELPAGKACLFFQGTASVGAGQGVSFGAGLLCVGGTKRRIALSSVSTLQETHYPRLDDAPLSVVGGVPSVGGTRYYQLWYRDLPPVCGAAPFNLTNAVQIDWSH